VRLGEACPEQLDGSGNERIPCDWALRHHAARLGRTRDVRGTEVVQRVHDVVRILRQVPELERVDFERDERERCGDADAHGREALPIKPLGSDVDDPVIVRQEVDPARVRVVGGDLHLGRTIIGYAGGEEARPLPWPPQTALSHWRTRPALGGMAMAHLRMTAHYEAPIEHVFALVVDYERYPEWNVSYEEVTEVVGPPDQVGSKMHGVMKLLGRKLEG
jgi:hypothetical protein